MWVQITLNTEYVAVLLTVDGAFDVCYLQKRHTQCCLHPVIEKGRTIVMFGDLQTHDLSCHL